MMTSPSILMVGTNRRNLQLLARYVGQEGYASLCAGSLAELDQVLDGRPHLCLALVDVSGFGPGIWQRCERLKQDGTPFLIVLPAPSAHLRQEGMSRGARGVLVKPLAVRELMALVQNTVHG